MIFVIFGTHNQDFSRLAKAIDAYALTCEDEIIVQTGHTNYPFKNVSLSYSFCEKVQMNKYLNDAELLIMQGGWGTIEEALDLRKKIVAVPRINGIEHVHNQEQLVRKLDSLGCLTGCYEVEELAECVNLARKTEFRVLEKGSATSLISEKLQSWFEVKELS